MLCWCLKAKIVLNPFKLFCRYNHFVFTVSSVCVELQINLNRLYMIHFVLKHWRSPNLVLSDFYNELSHFWVLRKSFLNGIWICQKHQCVFLCVSLKRSICFKTGCQFSCAWVWTIIWTCTTKAFMGCCEKFFLGNLNLSEAPIFCVCL